MLYYTTVLVILQRRNAHFLAFIYIDLIEEIKLIWNVNQVYYIQLLKKIQNFPSIKVKITSSLF